MEKSVKTPLLQSILQEILGHKIGLRGEYARFIDDPAPNFAMMVYGRPFRGKSSWSLCFAHELARTIAPVFYWATEEGISKTLQEKIGRLGVARPNLDFGKKLPSDLSKFRFRLQSIA